MRWYHKISLRNYILTAAGMIAVHALILYWMGQAPICKCGYVKLWHGVVFSSENSQHLTDWYTFSHIIHGFGFYFIAWLLFRKPEKRIPIGLALLGAVAVEAAWEIFENTDFVINRYREVTISLDYYGDSIINSVFDILAMIFGFWLAYRLPVWPVILLTVLMEAYVGWSIRDNLTLNIIMLIHPFQAILDWQRM